MWQEELEGVAIEDGKVLAQLGTARSLPTDSGEYWLELNVAGDTLWPRVRLHESPKLYVDQVLEAGVLDVSEIWTNTHPPYPHFYLHNFGEGGNSYFSTRKTGSAGPSTRLLIAGAGDVHLFGGSDASLGAGSGYLVIGKETATSLVLDDNEIMARNNHATSTLYLQQDGGAVFVNGAVAHASDARLKAEIRDLEAGLAEVLALRPVSFAWKKGDDRRHFGLIAQEVQALSNSLIYEDEKGYMGVAYTDLVPLLIRAVQEQHAEIEALEAELGSLQSRVAALEISAPEQAGLAGAE